MPYVLTVDQIGSRRRTDAVAGTMRALTSEFPDVALTRTVGDEFEALFVEPVSVVDAILTLMREGVWHVGLGLGTVERPTPRDLREARGPGFQAARLAVEDAKDRADHLRVVAATEAGPGAAEAAHDAEVLLALVLALRARRTPAGWAAADLADDGLSQAEVGARLGISRQAAGQRLQAAQWSLDAASRPVAARLLDRAERRAVGTGDAA